MNILFTLISCTLDAIAMLLYFHGLFGSRKKKIPLPLFILSYGMAEVFMTINPQIIQVGSGTTAYFTLIICSTIVTLLLTLLYRSSWRNRIFTTISFQAIALLSENIVYTTIPSSHKYSILVQSENTETVWNCFSKIVSLCIIIIAVYILKRRRQAYPFKYNILVMTVPILSPVILFFVIDYSDVIVNGIYLYQLICILGLFIINVVNYILFDYVLLSHQLTIENKQIQQQENFQKNKYEQLSAAYRNTRSIVHDTKKHLFILQSYLDSGSTDSHTNMAIARDLRKYLRDTISDLEKTVSRINTGNIVIDSFLSNYLSMAEKDKIDIKTNLQIDKSLININEYDLCVVLGNLLDNSYSSCKSQDGKKDIEVNISTDRGNLIIYITNSLPPTQKDFYKKEENLIHGYGLKNVDKIVHKYHGTFINYIEKDRYNVIATFPYDLNDSRVH